jgi:hypothetical protein
METRRRNDGLAGQWISSRPRWGENAAFPTWKGCVVRHGWLVRHHDEKAIRDITWRRTLRQQKPIQELGASIYRR